MLTMMLSIMHRITGGALYFGALFLAWWLVATASGPEAYSVFQAFAGSLIGKLMLFGFTWALIHHMLGGLRHFLWDTGRGFDLPVVEFMAKASLTGSVILTLVIWAFVLTLTGGQG